MLNRLQYILLLALMLFSAFKAAAQFVVPENVCVGATKHYWVDNTSTSTYIWKIVDDKDGTIIPVGSTTNEVYHTWNTSGSFTLSVQEFSADGCPGIVQTGTVFVSPAPSAPAAGVTAQPSCSVATGTITVTVPAPGADISYTVTGTVPVVASVTNATGLFAGLAPGLYDVITTNTVTGCVSTATALTVNAVPGAPAAPAAGVTAQPSCSVATGTITVSSATSGLTFSIDGSTFTNTTGIFTAVTQGDYFVSAKNSDGCISSQSNKLTINDQPATPTAAISGNATICAGSSDILSVTLTGTGPWSILYTDGVTPVPVNNILNSPYDFGVSPTVNTTYTLTSVSDLNCTGTVSGDATVTIASQITPTFAGIGLLCQNSTAPMLPLTSINNITGTWSPSTISTSTIGTTTYTFTPTGNSCATIVTLNIKVILTVTSTTLVTICSNQLPYSWNNNVYASAGTFNVKLTSAAGCDSIATLNLIVVTSVTPTFATIGPLCQNSIPPSLPFTSINGITGTWNPAIINTNTIGSAVYKFTPLGGQCINSTTLTIQIFSPPTAPVVGTIAQPTCATATGSVVLSGLPAGTWTINPGAVTGTGASTTISGLAANTYNFTVTSAAGCTSPASANVVINAQPATPAAPTAGVTLQPTCAVSTGTIVVTAPLGAAYEYSIDGSTYQGTATFAGLVPNTYSVTVRNISDPTCASAATVLTVNPAAGAPVAPTAGVTVQPTCAVSTGTIVVTAPLGAAYEYSLDGSTYQGTATFAGLVPNTYSVTVRNISDPTCASAATVLTVNPAAGAPVAPTAITQPNLITQTGKIIVTVPAMGTGYEYSLDGSVYQANATFTAVRPGNHIVTVRSNNDNTCISQPTTVTLTIFDTSVLIANDDYASISWIDTTKINVLINDYDSGNNIQSIVIKDKPKFGTAIINNDGTVTYIPFVNHSERDKFVYQVYDSDGLSDTAVVIIDIYDIGLKIPEGLSPNGDGINDKFEIKGLENFVNSQLMIFNRSGQIVFQSNDYQNDWNGRSLKNGVLNYEPVPTGTYYYVLKLGGTARTIKGFIYIGY